MSMIVGGGILGAVLLFIAGLPLYVWFVCGLIALATNRWVFVAWLVITLVVALAIVAIFWLSNFFQSLGINPVLAFVIATAIVMLLLLLLVGKKGLLG